MLPVALADKSLLVGVMVGVITAMDVLFDDVSSIGVKARFFKYAASSFCFSCYSCVMDWAWKSIFYSGRA